MLLDLLLLAGTNLGSTNTYYGHKNKFKIIFKIKKVFGYASLAQGRKLEGALYPTTIPMPKGL